MQLWESTWAQGADWLTETDVELLLLTCEQLDERQQLRVQVLRDGGWRDRAGLRALDAQIQAGLALLRSMTPKADTDDGFDALIAQLRSEVGDSPES